MTKICIGGRINNVVVLVFLSEKGKGYLASRDSDLRGRIRHS